MNEKQVVAFSKEHAAYFKALTIRIAKRKSLFDDIGECDLEELTTAVGGPDKVENLVRAMPKNPPLSDVIKAFGGDFKRLETLVNSTLGGNSDALAVILDPGCNNDPAKLVALAEKLKDGESQKRFKAVVQDGGFAGNPLALAEVLATGCGGKVDEFANFIDGFDDPDDVERLEGIMSGGGLGAAPGALAGLVKSGGATLIKKMGTEFTSAPDRKKLSGLLSKGGLGGENNENPHSLASVLSAFGDDPNKLKNLHDAFGEDDLGDLATIVHALDSGSKADSSKTGERLKKIFDGFDARTVGTDQDKFDRIKTVFFKNITSVGGSRSGPEDAGPAATEKMQQASVMVSLPPQAVAQPGVETCCTDEMASDLLVASGKTLAEIESMDPAERKSAAAAAVLGANKADDEKNVAMRTTQAAALLDGLPGVTSAEKDMMTQVVTATYGATLTADAARTLAVKSTAANDEIRAALSEQLEIQTGAKPGSAELLALQAENGDKAKLATTAAAQMEKALSAAKAPVDPRLLSAAAAAARAAQEAAALTVDETDRHAAIDAAILLTEAIAGASDRLAALVTTRAALNDPDGQAGLAAAREAETAKAALAKLDVPGLGAPAKKVLDDLRDELDETALSAGAAALVGAEITRIQADPDLKKKVEAAAKAEAIDDTPEALVSATKAINEQAKASKVKAETATAALTPMPVPPTIAQIVAACEMGELAMRNGRLAVDDTIRTETLAAAQAAIRASTAAAKALAKHHMKGARTRLSAEAKIKVTASRGPSDAFVAARGAEIPANGVPPDPGVAAAAANGPALDGITKAREGLSDAAAIRAEGIARDTPAVQTARLAAATAATLAEMPGAPPAARLGAVEKDLAAAVALATAVKQKAIDARNALTGPGPGTGDQILKAVEVTKAAIGAALKVVELTRRVVDAARMLEPDAKAKANAPGAVAADGLLLTRISDLAKDTANTVEASQTAMAALDADIAQLRVDAKALSDASAPPDQAAITTAAGFVAMVDTEGFRVGGGAVLAQAKDNDDLILAASTFDVKDPHALAAWVGAADESADLEHFCGRHARSHHAFEGRDLHDEAEVLAGAMVDLQTGPARTTEDRRLLKQSKFGNKPTTMWPDGVTDVQVRVYISDAITAAGVVLGEPLSDYLWPTPPPYPANPNNYRKTDLAITGSVAPTGPFKVMFAASRGGSAPEIEVGQFAPVGLESFTLLDLKMIRKALG